MKIRVAINGFGRIGRAFFKLALEKSELEIVAINDLGEPENLAYLLKYDSVYGRHREEISIKSGNLSVGERGFKMLNEKDPRLLPWRELDIDVALESTGVFASFEKSSIHLEAGAKRVVVSAPVKDEPREGIVGATVLMGVNEERLKVCDISSNASCTTNAGGPVMQILQESVGVKKALLNTVHGYTASQSLVDSPNSKKPRRGRAAAVNIVPSTTGSAIATTKAVEGLEGKFDGIALRVPVINGSIADITFLAGRETTVEEINDIFSKAARDPRWDEVFDVTDDDLVSTDIIGNPHASIIDLGYTRVVGGDLVKVLAWYDNELGYTTTLVNHVIKTGTYLKNGF